MKAFESVLTHWTQQVKELFPQLHSYQQATLASCVQGVVQSGSAVIQQVSEALWDALENETKVVSHERRIQRFIANERIDLQSCWKQFLQQVLAHWKGTSLILVLDMTPYTDQATIIYLGILVESRVLPIAWQILPQQEQWEQKQWELIGELFAGVSPLLAEAACTLVADRGLSCLPLIRLCQQAGWHYVFRIKQDTWWRKKYRKSYGDWQQSKHWIKQEGQAWYGEVLLWQEHGFATSLSICWEKGYEEPWLLMSDKRACHKRVTEYGRRMRVESTFQDCKSRGCMIECSRFSNKEHLHRWLFVVFLAIWWMVHLGSSCVHHGYRGQVDRADRRDKGLFRIGRLWFKAILKRAQRHLSAHPPTWVIAQLASCLPFSHRKGHLIFSLHPY